MGITALVLGGWISVYCGFSLIRTGLPEMRPGNAPADPRKIITAVGYALLVLGIAIFAFALRHKFH